MDSCVNKPPPLYKNSNYHILTFTVCIIVDSLTGAIPNTGKTLDDYLVDTNVVLDVLLNRPTFVQDSATILRAASENIQEFITASAVTDIYYITRNPSDFKDSSLQVLTPQEFANKFIVK